jgi:hypothetical protein
MQRHTWILVKRIPDHVHGVVADLVVSDHCIINKRNTFPVPKYDVSNVCILIYVSF